MLMLMLVLITAHSSVAEILSREKVVDPSEVTIVIVGPTGSGKSSLANVLLGMSPLCSNCTFPVCSSLHSCTKQTSVSSGPWLGQHMGQLVKIVDTPGFGDSDGEDNLLLDEMMTVMKESVQSADIILLLLKEGETRLGGHLQQMMREMKAMFGDGMWSNLVVGVSFWSYQQDMVKFRSSMCQYSKSNCRDEEWFVKEMSDILKDKFKFELDLPFVFIDSWAKHPLNAQDVNQQEIFLREAEKLLNIGKKATPFQFRTVNDVLAENHVIKKRNAVLEGKIKEDIRNLFENTRENNESLSLLAEHIGKAGANVAQVRNLTQDGIKHIEISMTQIKEEIINHKLSVNTLKNSLNKEISDSRTKTSNKFENISSRLAVTENEIKNVKTQTEKEISNVKQQQEIFRTRSDGKTNEVENEMLKTKGEMRQLQVSQQALQRRLAAAETTIANHDTNQKSILNRMQGAQNRIGKVETRVGKVLAYSNCQVSGWVNNWDQTFNFICPGTKVLRGVHSYHINDTEDRRFQFMCCNVIIK